MEEFIDFIEYMDNAYAYHLPRRYIRHTEDPLDGYSDQELLQKYRFSRDVLINITLTLTIGPRDGEVNNRRGLPLSPIMKMCIALRLYAAGSFQQVLGALINVIQSSASRVVTKASQNISTHIAEYIKFGNNTEELKLQFRMGSFSINYYSAKKRKRQKEQFAPKHDLPLREAREWDFKIDEVVLMLVYTKNDMIASLKRSRIKYYLKNLERSGLTVDSIQSLTDDNIVFVRISAVQDVLRKYAPSLGIPLHCENPFFLERSEEDHYVKNLFTVASEISLEYRKLSQSLGNIKIREITESEKLQIMYQILKFAKYGYADDEVGINRLLGQGTIQTVYPTHERYTEDEEDHHVRDRQLLRTLWASWKFIFRKQPTFLIHKYFGAEVGFYFAFLNYMARMLIPAAIIGVLTFLIGIISMTTDNNFKTKEVCSSKIIMCPTCYIGHCNYTFLNQSCPFSDFNHIIDNQITVVYGILISIWSTLSYELWKREQSSLAYQWNVHTAHINVNVRPQYENSATLRKISPVTGEWEPYEDSAVRICHTVTSIIIMALLCCLSVSAIIGLTINYNGVAVSMALIRLDHSNCLQVAWSKVTASLISVVLMIAFDSCYKYIAVWLVRYENPRTEQEFDNSYILKIYFLTFINSFGVAIYIAFFKGRFYFHPAHIKASMNYVTMDHCDPTGCAENLFIHVLIVLSVKCILKDFYDLGMIYVMMLWRKYRIRMVHAGTLPSYEEDYYLNNFSRFHLFNAYKEIAIQYGYITFFSSAQPLAPLIVLLHTLIKIRIHAIKIMDTYKRPVPIRTSGIGAWMQVFMAMTHLGVVTNALVIGWTMNFVPSTIYALSNIETPFYESRLAAFNTSDYPTTILEHLKSITSHPPTCRYIGVRYPPDHPKKYELNGDFWHEVTWIMAFIIIFEHVVLAITSVIAYSIPDMPTAIRQLIEHENLRIVKENYRKIGEIAAVQSDVH